MTGMGEDVYEAGPRGDAVQETVLAAVFEAIGKDRYDALPDKADYLFRKQNAEAEYWDKSEAEETFRAALESLGVPLEVLAALEAGTWQAVPKEPTREMTAAGGVAFSTTHRHPNGVFTDMLTAAPTTPTEES